MNILAYHPLRWRIEAPNRLLSLYLDAGVKGQCILVAQLAELQTKSFGEPSADYLFYRFIHISSPILARTPTREHVKIIEKRSYRIAHKARVL